jgi:hypothetical protein
VADDCGLIDIGCEIKGGVSDVISGAATNAIEGLAQSVGEAVVEGLAAVGTLWLKFPTPALTGSSPVGGTSAATPPGTAGLETVMGYAMWVSLGICVLSLMVAGVRLALPNRHSGDMADGVTHVSRTLLAVIVISAATALVTGLLADGNSGEGASETVAFLQNSLWWYVLALAMLSVVVGGARMAWEQRAQPGKDLVKSLLTLIAVSSFGLVTVGLCVAGADAFAEWIVESSLEEQGGSSFKDAVSGMLGFTTLAGGWSAITVIVLGFVAFMTCLAQIVAMVARGGMLVLLAGILPVAAAATNTEMGLTWFKKCVSWLVAFILYKPAAAIVYAAAFRLLDTDVDRDGSGLVGAVSGLGLMIMAVVALPALMRFVTPMVGAMASGSSGGAGAAMAAVPAMGAVASAGRSGAGGAQSPSAGGGGGTSSATGAASSGGSGSAGQSGSSGGSGRPGPSGSSGGSGSEDESPSTSASSPGFSGAGSSGGASGAASSAGTAAASAGGAAVPAASAGTAAASGRATAGAGPAGVVAGQAVEAAQRGQEAVTKTAQGAANEGDKQ